MKKNLGFTLLELMITIAIVGILASIAYPSYNDSVTKGRRADAMASLMGFSQAMERFYTDKGTYSGAGPSGNATGSPSIYSTQSPADGSEKYYDLTIVSADGTTFEIMATAIGTQSGDGNLTLTATGARKWGTNNCWSTSC